MGIIISGIRLIQESYDFVLKMAPKVHTTALQRGMEEFVRDSFQTLRPLTYEYREVCEIQKDYGSGSTYIYKLCMGEWLRVKGSYQTYGSSLDHSGEVFNHIRKYGDELKPHVRKPIKDDFANIVDSTKKLQSYDDILVKLEIPETEVFEYDCGGRDGENVTVEMMVTDGIGIETRDPWTLLIFKEGKDEPKSRSLTEESKISIFEDIIGYIVDLFKKADAEVKGVREHNEKIMEEMSKTVGPWKIANELKS